MIEKLFYSKRKNELSKESAESAAASSIDEPYPDQEPDYNQNN